jgi:hypothetical protein
VRRERQRDRVDGAPHVFPPRRIDGGRLGGGRDRTNRTTPHTEHVPTEPKGRLLSEDDSDAQFCAGPRMSPPSLYSVLAAFSFPVREQNEDALIKGCGLAIMRAGRAALARERLRAHCML